MSLACGNAYHDERGDVQDCTPEAKCRRCLEADIHDLKEQVASLQRALAHNRDRDSVVDG